MATTPKNRSFIVCLIMGCWLASTAVGAETLNEDALNALKWREIGPWRGGRVTAVTGVPGNEQLYYMGAAGGGVWRTVNGGTSWTNLSDGHFKVGTIGAIAVAPSATNVLYVGTGEAPIRGVTTSHGDGVWKSTDGGSNWQHIGLKEAGQIAKILVHPRDPDTVWVAVQGQIWGPSQQRGVFKTTDGGASWTHSLAVNEETGATDLTMDPANPTILYAAMWHHGRTPWFIKSGGDGGGIYKSSDGGDSWKQLTKGLPELMGKVGIDVAESNPARVYAIVEAELGQGGLFRSDNHGESWSRINDRRVLHSRAWYYNHITVDPTNDNTVWVQNVPLMKSIDGGKTFERVYTPHSDHHDHWINPKNPLNMISGNDGGGTITYDGGETWSSIMNQPTAQFYRVVTDNLDPFRIYGGQQDNSTVSIASASLDGGIGVADYHDVGGGESAHIAFDPDNPRLIYATTINNTLTEYDRDTQTYRYIMPYPEHVFGMDARDLKYRANWNAPVLASPHDPSIIYYGTQLLLRSTDRGRTWEEISGDLTRNEPDKQGRNGGPLTPENVGAEYYNTIFAITESPHSPGELWVGADDGLVHLSQDGGASWDNVTPAKAPEGMVNTLEISPHDPETVYYPLARYKLNDFRPYIYKTTDRGQRWKRIDEGLPDDTFVRVVREDPQQKDLLYAGTEAGLFVSFNGGDHWQRMTMNFPVVPITDLAIRHDKLVAATQGRGFWVFDDLSLIRQLSQPLDSDALVVLQPKDAPLGRRPSGADDFEGANPPGGVVFTYRVPSGGDEAPLTIEVLDSNGSVLRRYSSEEGAFERCRLGNMDLRSPFTISYPGKTAGLHQWSWDRRRAPLKCIDDARNYVGFSGPGALPGDYQVRVSQGDQSSSAAFTLEADPHSLASIEELAVWDTAVTELAGLYNAIVARVDGVRSARAAIDRLQQANPDAGELSALASTAREQLSDWEARTTQLKFDTYEDEDSWPPLIDGQVVNLFAVINATGAPVSAGSLERKADLEGLWQALDQELDTITEQALQPINDWAEGNNSKIVPDPN